MTKTTAGNWKKQLSKDDLELLARFRILSYADLVSISRERWRIAGYVRDAVLKIVERLGMPTDDEIETVSNPELTTAQLRLIAMFMRDHEQILSNRGCGDFDMPESLSEGEIRQVRKDTAGYVDDDTGDDGAGFPWAAEYVVGMLAERIEKAGQGTSVETGHHGDCKCCELENLEGDYCDVCLKAMSEGNKEALDDVVIDTIEDPKSPLIRKNACPKCGSMDGYEVAQILEHVEDVRWGGEVFHVDSRIRNKRKTARCLACDARLSVKKYNLRVI